MSEITTACRWCGGTNGEHDGAMHDAVAATGTPAYWTPDAPTPTPVGDDQREALAALDRIVRQVPHNLRSNSADYTVAGDIEAVKAALTVRSLTDRDWLHAQERLRTLHGDLAAARAALAARPSEGRAK